MLITETLKRGVLVTIVEPRIDMFRSREFRDKLGELAESKPEHVVIDFEKNEYFGSSALGSLVMFTEKVRAYDGRVSICNLKNHHKTIFNLTKSVALFDIQDTLEACIS
jgi:anti-anti-sigma factor